MIESTVYCCRAQPVSIDEVRERLGAYGLPATVMQDAEEGAATARWFVTLEADPASEEDTMLDAQMVVMDVSSDAMMVKGSAGSLLMGFEGADEDEDIRIIRSRLKSARQSFFCSVTSGSQGLKILQLATLTACLEVGEGVLHDGTREEFFTQATIGGFLTNEIGTDANSIISALNA